MDNWGQRVLEKRHMDIPKEWAQNPGYLSHFYALHKAFIAEEELSKQVDGMTCPMCVSLCSQLFQCLPDRFVYRKTMLKRRRQPSQADKAPVYKSWCNYCLLECPACQEQGLMVNPQKREASHLIDHKRVVLSRREEIFVFMELTPLLM